MTDLSSFQIPQFSPIWTFTPDQILATASNLSSRAADFNDYMASIETPSVENLLQRLIDEEDQTMLLENQIVFLSYVSNGKEIRNASREAERIVDETSIVQSSRVDVYNVFKKLQKFLLDSKKEIEPELQKYLDKTVRSYERNGLNLSQAERDQIKALKLELSVLQTTYSKNINEENGHISFTKAQLDGVPDSVLEQFETEKGNNGTLYHVTFKYPDIIPVLKYAKNQETRKAAHMANSNLLPENAEILAKIIKTRYRIARLLGYKNYSEFVLEKRLAKNPQNVFSFLDDLKSKLYPLALNEKKSLLELKNADLKARGLPPQNEYYAWDHPYYDNLLLEQKYKVNHHKIAEYFPLSSTIEKMLGFYETLFDVKFVEEKNPDPKTLWHPDVRKIAVYSNIKFGKPKNEFMGWILFDLHPREGKYSHAANFGISTAFIRPDGTRAPTYSALVCNFTKPTKKKPALLKHDEVTTFFHELGHGMHDLLSRTKLSQLQGTNVPRDFVECPSQMLEFWTWSKNELYNLSSHYKTGEPIPDDLIDKLVASKKVNTGLQNLRQMLFAYFDMKLHTISSDEELENLDIPKLWNSLRENVTLLSNGGHDNIAYCKFSHIAGGYESGYYGYLYSQAFAADIFYTHFKDDPMNVQRGLQYRDTILKNGGALEVWDILKDLLGRPPNSEAFLKDILGNQEGK